MLGMGSASQLASGDRITMWIRLGMGHGRYVKSNTVPFMGVLATLVKGWGLESTLT
jgi:hypothetical protein